MAQQQMEKKGKQKKKKRELPGFMKMDPIWRMPPVETRAKDGSRRKLTIEHRIGRDIGSVRGGGVFTVTDLMKKRGYDKIWYKLAKKLEKKFPDPEEFEMISESMWRTRRRKVKNEVRSLRNYLGLKFYAEQEIVPIMTWVPIDDKHLGIFIQGFKDVKTNRPIVFDDIDDVTLAVESEAAFTKSVHDAHKDALKTARATMALPGINKDIRERLALIASGRVGNRPMLSQKT